MWFGRWVSWSINRYLFVWVVVRGRGVRVSWRPRPEVALLRW